MSDEPDLTTIDLRKLGAADLSQRRARLMERLGEFQSRDLQIDMTRGKPCPEQLDLALGMLECVDSAHYQSADGLDCRNYGGLDGIPEAKQLFSRYLGVEPGELIVGGNASLNMMYDTILRALVHGVPGGERAWGELPQPKFLCPSPGYDRHFSICEHLDIEMISVEIGADGPDMDQIEGAVAEDEGVVGIWCVPKYSNPTGVTYSDEVVGRLASMETKAADFRVFWDNAYAVHDLSDEPDELRNVLTACKEAGNPDRVLVFGSTSKISFAGAGLALMAGSRKNIEFTLGQMFFQTIGPDKLNQLRHVRFFKDMDGIRQHMRKHAAILKPKFDTVQSILDRELGGKNIADWSQPAGGYFLSVNTLDGCAQAVVDMAAHVGVKLTPAGATYPYRMDPRNRNLRIAPSFPSLGDIQTAMEIVAICIQVAGIDRLLAGDSASATQA